MVTFGIGTAGHNLSPGSDHPGIDTSGLAPALVAATAPVVNEITASAPVRTAVTVAVKANEEVQEMAAAVLPAKPEAVTREVEMPKGGSFASMLTDAGVDPAEAAAVATALDKVYNHKKLKAGQEITLSFTRLGADETLTSITFQPEPTKEIAIARGADNKFAGQTKTTPIERERFAVRAEIRSSLYEAGAREGVPRSIMAALLRAYAHAVDFQRDIHPGDKFEVLYDQPTTKDGKPVGQGVIIYAALEVGGKTKPLYRVTFADGAVDYFDEKGQSVKRALLRTPVDSARVTSGYGMRMHPILGYSQMHKGVDFGAPLGSPIFAAGSGVIEEVGFKGAYGRYVRIRHNGKIQTAYAHISRYARGIHSGARINQGDVIGFVGSSGRSTGPHLHYEVLVNKRQVNPMSVNMPVGRVLQGKLLAQFRDGQNRIKQEFSALLTKDQPTAVAQAPAPEAQTAKNTGMAPGFTNAAAKTPAFNNSKPTNACGLRGGC